MSEDPEHNLVENWVASLDDDSQMTMGEHGTYDRVPPDRCKAIRLFVRGRPEPIHAACVPENGDRMRLFMRRAIKIGGLKSSNGRTLNMPVIEIYKVDAEGAELPGFVRLYVHPVHGVIVSTMTLEL